MYRFVSSQNPVKLKKAYLKEYNIKLLQDKLDKLMKAPTSIDMVTNMTENTQAKTKGKVVGRNDLCPCGSGLKYKNCCGKNAK